MLFNNTLWMSSDSTAAFVKIELHCPLDGLASGSCLFLYLSACATFPSYHPIPLLVYFLLSKVFQLVPGLSNPGVFGIVLTIRSFFAFPSAFWVSCLYLQNFVVIFAGITFSLFVLNYSGEWYLLYMSAN